MKSTIGIVISSTGDPGELYKSHCNFFSTDADKLILDSATNNVLYSQQKPLALYKELVELFTKPGDWIFSGPTGIGMYYRNGSVTVLTTIQL